MVIGIFIVYTAKNLISYRSNYQYYIILSFDKQDSKFIIFLYI